MRRRPEIDVVVLTVSLALAMLPVIPVFGARALVAPVLAGLICGAGLAVVAAHLRWGTAVTIAAALAAYLLVGPAVVGDATRGPLPSARSTVDLLTAAVTAWKQVLTLEPQLGTAGTVLAAPFLLALVGSLGALSLALRTRRAGALAALVPLAVLVVCVVLSTKVAVFPVAAGVGMVLSLVSWVSWRSGTLAPRRVVSIALVAAVVTALGSVTAPWLAEQRARFVTRDEIVPPFDPADQPSPLSAFRAFVKDWGDTDLLTVRGLPEGATVRLATMDAFDGVVWDVAGAAAAEGSGSFRRVGSEVDPLRRVGQRATVRFEAGALPFVWLPTVGWAKQVTFSGGDGALRSQLRYNDATGTAALVDGVPRGLEWTEDVVVPTVPTEPDLDRATTARVVLPKPQEVPDMVRTRAAQIAGTAGSPGLIARSLEEELSTDGYFSHGLVDRGDTPSLSGHGANRITDLLGTTMVGDGEQYASAMALMAREMGLPSRVVLGFVPDPAVAGDPAITFTGSDIQAWVEVDFAGYGWVSFFPTPDQSRTPRQDTSPQQAAADPAVRQPPPPPQDPVTAPDDDTEQPTTDDNQDRSQPSEVLLVLRRAALLGGVPTLLVLGPPLLLALLKGRRRRRRRRAEDGVRRVIGGWDEVLDRATDLRRDVPDQATRREIAVALAGSFGPAGTRPADGGRRSAGIGGPVATLAARADAVVFSGRSPTEAEVEAYWTQVDNAVGAMRRAVPRRVRWRSWWTWASLRGAR
ncbi:transglutaminase-like domain-containing protein [Isoptericola sp. b441]|uniref:Transglutaminase-like domain-containing protein n=1 Tax=Actinotalea lenta TaxID=3064654 RepID=A0ABT9DA02_9CELL|nr:MULTISPECIES: transglutaminase-like domain-containing protein [unclassified Isoptericola]MDO8105777.1 transglutaminase-like domain-containing protein [Isoptericola sp. b441]MDO8122482.1 transglutaminase-like domain-containing protein [Isoptericola sp. b490]